MTVDTKVYDFARTYLQAGGWTHSQDIERLAELIQVVAEDFVKDLEVQDESNS